MEQNKKVPSIRFKGFEDECVFKVLDSIAYFYKGKEHSWKDIDEKGIYKVILYGNLYTNYGMIISDVILKTNYISEKTFFGKKNDVLIPSSDTTPIGIARASSLEIDNVILGGDINIIRPIGIDGNYLSLNLNSNKNKLISLIKGSTVRHIDNSDLKKIDLYISDSIIEQTQIGNFFKTIDEQINLQEQKQQELVNLKKAMLEKMFPKEGADVPEIRFNGFTEKWEEKKLGDIASFKKGQGFTKKDLKNNGTPIILYGRLYTKYHTEICDVDTYADGNIKAVFSSGNEVIVPASGESAEDISRASAVLLKNIILGGDLNVIMPSYCLNSSFVAISLTYGRSKKDISKRAKGKSVVHVHNTDLKDVKIIYPSIEEQENIVIYFRELDKLIETLKIQIEKHKNIKQALLQKMFV